MSDLEHFVGLETAVWAALVHGDADADQRLLTSDFLGVYPSGFSDRDGHTGQLDNGPTIASFEIHDAQIIKISPAAVLLSYRAVFSRTASPADDEAMLVSSLWVDRDGHWLNSFSQDTTFTGVPLP